MKNDNNLLRPLDLNTVKSGDPIFNFYGKPYNFLVGPDAEGNIVISGACGIFALMSLSDARMVPITWIEGKPVYKGDVLYYSIIDKQYPLVVSRIDTDFRVCNDRGGWIITNKLTWVKAPVCKEGWMNICPNNRAQPEIFQTREDADKNALRSRIDCIQVNWME